MIDEHNHEGHDHAEHNHAMTGDEGNHLRDYIPLFLVLAGIFAVTAFWQLWVNKGFVGLNVARDFMGFFFLTFGIFKLLDLKGFAGAYAEYDIVAKRSRVYAFAYPFIEVALGVAFLLDFQYTAINITTLIIMAIGSIGVIQALRSKRPFRCACLGTVVKLPMSTVTVVEDVGMGLMALVMLLI